MGRNKIWTKGLRTMITCLLFSQHEHNEPSQLQPTSEEYVELDQQLRALIPSPSRLYTPGACRLGLQSIRGA